jgi:hypothetical protein
VAKVALIVSVFRLQPLVQIGSQLRCQLIELDRQALHIIVGSSAKVLCLLMLIDKEVQYSVYLKKTKYFKNIFKKH